MKLRFPSKTFLLGEYAVVGGGAGLLAGHGPWFQAEFTSGLPAPSPFHPDSPAGRQWASAGLKGSCEFFDAHGGRGGFGGSGAEFLSVWFANQPLPTTDAERTSTARAAWRASRLFSGSGADILTQAWGVNLEEDFFLLSVDTTQGNTERVVTELGAELSFFHTGRKVKTHDHLDSKPVIPSLELNSLVVQGTRTLRENNAAAFASVMNQYASTLRQAGLMAAHTAAALDQLSAPGVLAAKGCGAMGADVIAVLHRGADLTPWAEANSLAEVARQPV